MTIKVTYNPEGEKELFALGAWKTFITDVMKKINAVAKPIVGFQSGDLRGSMDFLTEEKPDGTVVGLMGSNTGGVELDYARHHMADAHPNNPSRAQWHKGRKPYTKAMKALGIDSQIEPGGYEV